MRQQRTAEPFTDQAGRPSKKRERHVQRLCAGKGCGAQSHQKDRRCTDVWPWPELQGGRDAHGGGLGRC